MTMDEKEARKIMAPFAMYKVFPFFYLKGSHHEVCEAKGFLAGLKAGEEKERAEARVDRDEFKRLNEHHKEMFLKTNLELAEARAKGDELEDAAYGLICHLAFTEGTASYINLPRGIVGRVRELASVLANHKKSREAEGKT